MKRKSLSGILKANLPQYLWISLPLYVGAIILGLNGQAPEWGPIVLFLVTVTILYGTAEFSNTYADRHEDSVFVPSSPFVTGELDERTGKKAFILQNIVGGLALVVLLVLTLNYYLFTAVAAGWVVGLTHSLPPFRFKERALCPFWMALGLGISAIAGWLVVSSLDRFIICFGLLFTIESFSIAVSSTKLRKTFDLFHRGDIQDPEGKSIWDLRTSGLGMRVKTAVALEAISGLGAFALVPIFWHLGVFNMVLSLALLTLPLAFMVLTVVFRLKDPAGNTQKCEQFAGMTWALTILSFFAVALATVVHWGFAILACIILLIGFQLLYKYVHPFGVAYRAI